MSDVDFQFLSMDELVAAADAERRAILSGETGWGRWSYEPSIFVLNHVDGYQVDLLRLNGVDDQLGMIHHLAAKLCFDAEDLGNFVRALHDLGNGAPCHGDRSPLWRALPCEELLRPLPTPMSEDQIRRRSGVYALRAGAHLKIGKAVDIAARRDSLQTGNAARLEVVAVLSKSSQDEGAWHRRFAHLRVAGEWFALGEQIAVWLRRARIEEGLH